MVNRVMDAGDLEQYVREAGIPAEVVRLAVETPTVSAAATAVNASVDQIVKSLLFLVDGEPLLVVANGETRVGYKRLADYLGVSRRGVKLANAAQVREILGYEVGAVPPFGHKTPVRTLVEAGVLAQEEVYAGGGGMNALVRLRVAELLRVIGGETANLAQE